jgi:hypothetical protein
MSCFHRIDETQYIRSLYKLVEQNYAHIAEEEEEESFTVGPPIIVEFVYMQRAIE